MASPIKSKNVSKSYFHNKINTVYSH